MLLGRRTLHGLIDRQEPIPTSRTVKYLNFLHSDGHGEEKL